MAGNSKHVLDINLWLHKCLDSCKTVDQATTMQKLIDLYGEYHNPKLRLLHELNLKLYDIQGDLITERLATKMINKVAIEIGYANKKK